MKAWIKYLLIGLVIPFSGCLENLNVTEFFRKLEIKNRDYYDLVSDNQGEIEELLKEELQDRVEGEITWITYWGESRYACGNVIQSYYGQDYVQVLGEYRLKDGEESRLYSAWFIPTEDDLISELEIAYY